MFSWFVKFRKFGFLKKNVDSSSDSMNNLSDEDLSNILRKVREVELKSGSNVDQALSGEYHSIFKGQGIDFDRVREYTAGDDVRAIDWNVTARTGVPHIKLYVEERELSILFMLDVSGSGDFGSGKMSKRDFSTELIATLAMSAVKNNDKIGLMLFSDEVESFILPNKGRSNFLRIVRESLYYKPKSNGTNIIEAINFINRVIKKRSTIFLVSDFRFIDNSKEYLKDFSIKLKILSKHHDVVAISVFDPLEGDLPSVGIISCKDPESDEILDLNTSNKNVRDWVYDIERQRLIKLRKLIRSQGVDFLELRTDKEFLPSLMTFFKSRSMRNNHF